MVEPAKVDTWLLEHTSQGHNKFYEVTINRLGGQTTQAYQILTRHGRIGQKGRILEYTTTNTVEKAKFEVQELIRTKIDKGYKLVKQIKAEPAKPKEEEEQSRFSKMQVE